MVIATMKERMSCPSICSTDRKFRIKFPDGSDPINICGRIMDFVITRDRHEIGRVSRAYYPMTDHYGLQIRQGEDVEFLLAVACT